MPWSGFHLQQRPLSLTNISKLTSLQCVLLKNRAISRHVSAWPQEGAPRAHEHRYLHNCGNDFLAGWWSIQVPLHRLCICTIYERDVSTCNITDHYKIKHSSLREYLMALNSSNANEAVLKARINQALYRSRNIMQRSGIKGFFNRQVSSNANANAETRVVPEKTLYAMALILFCCATELPSPRIASPILQGLIDMFGVSAQFSRKQVMDKLLFDMYSAICRILRSSERTQELDISLWVDGALLSTPPYWGWLGITLTINWNMRCVPMATLNIGTASKSGEQQLELHCQPRHHLLQPKSF